MRGKVEEIIVESGREMRSSIGDSHTFSRGHPKTVNLVEGESSVYNVFATSPRFN